MFDRTIKSSPLFKLVSIAQLFIIVVSFVVPPAAVHAQTFSVLSLPKPGTMVTTSEKYAPLLIKGIALHKENPLVFDFILDPGDSGFSDEQIKSESQRLIKYFFASLTVPEKDLWVNLSPYEKDRIIPDGFGQTEMGRDLLAQDYILKQLSASLVYPEKDLGKDFWNRVYRKAKEVYGTTDIPVNTFNKVWIVPDTAVIVESKTSAYITQSRLKVMLEEDYVSLNENRASEVLGTSHLEESEVKKVSNVTSAIVREIVLPEIEKEINEGKNFAQLRQIYAALLLATWFKFNLRDNIINEIYSNQNKLLGVDLEDKTDKEKIYNQYLAAFREGVFNYIKEDQDEETQEIIPRKYFSGGFDGTETSKILLNGNVQRVSADSPAGVAAVQAAQAEGGDVVVTAAASRSENVQVTNSELQEKRNRLLSTVQEKIAEFVRKGMSLLDASYLKALYAKFLIGREELKLNQTVIASASFEEAAREKVFGVYDSNSIVGNLNFTDTAKSVTVRVVQMKGGLGTSYKRDETVKRITGRDTLADKATDSFFEAVSIGERVVDVNVAGLKAQQYIDAASRGVYGQVIVQELVNDESEGPVRDFYKSPYYLDPTKTFEEAFSSTPNLSLDPQMIVQGVLPVVDSRTLDFIEHPKATAPGGHGFLGTLTLDRIASNAPTNDVPTVSVIVNGDGVNNFIPAEVVGWIVSRKIPIVMITTTKTGLDLKGGLVVVESPDVISKELRDRLSANTPLTQVDIQNQVLTPQLFELAQAKSVGQEDLFQGMGITQGESGGQFFNTNMSVYNENVLSPFLRELKALLGPDRYFEITSPDLIANAKEKNIDGVKREVFQMEGAKGSALLNLNKFIMTTTDPSVISLKEKFGIDRLVYFVNFDANNRTQVFTPEKYAWDHGVYERSDLFKINPQTGRLEKLGDPAKLPSIDLESYYTNIENVNRAWGQQVGMQQLDFLGIKGSVHFPNAVLKGTVLIQSLSKNIIDLNNNKNLFQVAESGRLILDNVFVMISETDQITVVKISDLQAAMSAFENNQSLPTVQQVEISEEIAGVQKANDVLKPDDSSGTMGRWDYDRAQYDATTGTITLINATRIPKQGKVEDRYLINGENAPRNITLQTRELKSLEREIVDEALNQYVPDGVVPRLIIRDDNSTFAQIYGIATQGIPFVREDIIAEGNIRQIAEAIDHENRELSGQPHDEIRANQFEGGLRNLLTQLSNQDKKDNNVGGIDFNPTKIKMEVNKQNGGVKVEFDPKILEEIRLQGFEGIVPVILNIQRVKNVIPLLSQNEEPINDGVAKI